MMIQSSSLKQFNCSIEKKNTVHGRDTKHDMHKKLNIYINRIALI